ncbi:hypothetical protein CHU98_g734 [Xylaria longipes]|nr:hypothetical protein CHU98_g734 [Xylaria longipes]
MDSKDIYDNAGRQTVALDAQEIGELAVDDDPKYLGCPMPFTSILSMMLTRIGLGRSDLISPLASSIFAPATSLMNAEFHNHSATLSTFTVSFFILGYVIGSLIAAPLSEQYGRKVIFWLLLILGGLTVLLQIFASRETNFRLISARKRAFKGRPRTLWHRLDWYAPVDLSDTEGYKEVNMAQSMLRPWKEYHWSIGISGLSYIGIGLGFLLGVLVIGSTSDRIMAKHTKLNGNVAVPEVRLKVCVYFSFLVPISFFWYGWSANQHAFWLAPIVGLACFGLGMIGIFLPLQTYMIDAFPDYAASSTAALASSRNVAGTFLPLAGPYLYTGVNCE